LKAKIEHEICALSDAVLLLLLLLLLLLFLFLTKYNTKRAYANKSSSSYPAPSLCYHCQLSLSINMSFNKCQANDTWRWLLPQSCKTL